MRNGESVILQHGHIPEWKVPKQLFLAYLLRRLMSFFNPTNGGERENHRWVIHEEISESTKGAFEPGEEVTLEANRWRSSCSQS